MTGAVGILNLPGSTPQLKPGMMCTVAGWGRQGVNNILSNTLRTVELEIQRDQRCNSLYEHYDSTTQICVGNPKKIQSSFKVRSPALPMPAVGVAEL